LSQAKPILGVSARHRRRWVLLTLNHPASFVRRRGNSEAYCAVSGPADHGFA